MEPVMHRWRPHRLPFSGAVALLLLVGGMPSHALDLSGTPWDSAARRHGLDPALLYAVALDATARPTSGDAIAPWPWTLRSGTDVHFYASRTAARADLRTMAEVSDDLEVGLMPIDLRRHAHRVGDPATWLDAAVNLVVATAILAEAIASAPNDPALGIGRSRYPNDERAARAYGQRVLRLRDALDRAPGGPVAGDVLDLWRTNAVLDLVAGPESRGHYNAWYRNARQSEVQLADLTVNEVRVLQRRLVRRHGGSAVGRYQIIADTLDGLIVRLGLAGDERFTPALQDRLAKHLAREAGLDAWLAGTLGDERFAANLARVWAGLPGDASNRSVYEGIRGNRATVGWRTLVASLRQLRVDASEPQ